MLSVSAFWTVLIPSVLAYFLYAKYVKQKRRLPLPPGPKGYPILGNIFNIPKGIHDWVVYDQWCKEYNTDILYLDMAGSPVVILNSYEAALELLEKRSSIYSGRPRMPMINELMGWDFDFAFMDYGERWKRHRKLMHHFFQPSAVHNYEFQQLKTARDLILKLRETNDVISNVRQLAGETIISIAYGIDVQPKNDPYINAAEEGVHTLLQAALPGAFLVDTIPSLKYVPEWIPGGEFRRKAREWRGLADRMLNKPFNALQKAMEDGSAKPSFGLRSLQTMQEGHIDCTLEDIKSVAATMYQAGSDSTLSAITFCIISLLGHPEILHRAQDEIDSVTEMTRLPEFRDQASLPYLDSLVKETLRFWAIVPLAVPHTVTSEDFYKGFRIPTGSMIIPNAWAMLHDEQVYKDPFTFNPERFLEKDETMDAHFSAAWGFGRRICPGRFMAYNSIWITMTSILTIYNVEKAVDVDGQAIEPSHEYVSSILIMPTPFECTFSIRSPAAKELLDSIDSGCDQ